MSVEAIVRVIEGEAAVEAAGIVAQAHERADVLVGDAETAAAARVRIALERAEPAYRAEAMRRVNESRLRLLELRAERVAGLVDDVFRAAEGGLAEIAAEPGSARWTAALEALIDEAIRLVGPDARVAVRAVDEAVAGPIVERLGGRLAGSAKLVDGSVPSPGALVVSADGRLTVDATIAARLAHARVALAEAVVRRLEVAD